MWRSPRIFGRLFESMKTHSVEARDPDWLIHQTATTTRYVTLITLIVELSRIKLRVELYSYLAAVVFTPE